MSKYIDRTGAYEEMPRNRYQNNEIDIWLILKWVARDFSICHISIAKNQCILLL